MLTVAALAVGIHMRYLAISDEDLSTYLLVRDKSCFVNDKSVNQCATCSGSPTMINHHTIVGVVVVSVPTVGCIEGSKAASRDDTRVVTLNINTFGHNSGQHANIVNLGIKMYCVNIGQIH